MKIHTLERIWIGLSILLIVGFIGSVTYGAVGVGVEMISDQGGTVETPNQPVEDDNFREPGIYRTGENEYDVWVLVRQFVFQPGSSPAIQLPAGSTATFHVTSRDVIHGFYLSGTNVNTKVVPGYITEFTVEFDQPATYDILCHEYCGTGHHLMQGTIEVVPPEEFDPEVLSQ